ncbi:MAG: protease modulator HflK [Verrucomicrobiota bacterium]
MISDRNIQKNGLVNLAALVGVGVGAGLTARYLDSAAGYLSMLFIGFGFLVGAVSYFQMRLEARERAEKMEYDELLRAKSASALFDSPDAESFPAQRARQQFERVFVPLFTAVLVILQGVVVYWQWTALAKANPLKIERATVGMALFGLFALVLFLLGKYAAGIARIEKQRLLRPGAGYMLLGAVLCGVTIAGLAAGLMGYPKVDLIAARVMVVLLGLTVIETLVTLIFEGYRPRMKGQVVRLLYESRLIGLLGAPESLITTAAHALDYQFGFKVSETWFYRFLERAFAWIVLVQLGILWISTMVVFIEPHEQAVIERLGSPKDKVLEPGLHVKLPWPVDVVYRFQTRNLQQFLVGVVPDENLEKEKVLLWTKAHYKEEINFLVASRQREAITNQTPSDQAVPVNLLTASIPVQYTIQNVLDWAYKHENAAEMLKHLATREVVNYLVSVDIDEIMAAGRDAAAKELQKRIQQTADANQLGVRIVFVGLQDIHPPVGTSDNAVAEAYEQVNGALQQREGRILSAQKEAEEIVPRARAAAADRLSRAESYKLMKISDGLAAQGRFPNQVLAYEASPEVYKQRTYLDTLARALQKPRKYLLATTNTSHVINFNLEDQVRFDLLSDVSVPDEDKDKKKK